MDQLEQIQEKLIQISDQVSSLRLGVFFLIGVFIILIGMTIYEGHRHKD